MSASYSHCPTNSLRTTTAAASLTPNQLHKLCPAYNESAILGQLQCRDGPPSPSSLLGLQPDSPTATKSSLNSKVVEVAGMLQHVACKGIILHPLPITMTLWGKAVVRSSMGYRIWRACHSAFFVPKLWIQTMLRSKTP
ncbi:hypothetical protein HJC23_002562 [Cyclotella cryptica]|uniref:Uncharacterized protein n=1 Tax=Cyclotella cryptica TaxID=29204 RepID=A0ABD3QWD6_9STRA